MAIVAFRPLPLAPAGAELDQDFVVLSPQGFVSSKTARRDACAALPAAIEARVRATAFSDIKAQMRSARLLIGAAFLLAACSTAPPPDLARIPWIIATDCNVSLGAKNIRDEDWADSPSMTCARARLEGFCSAGVNLAGLDLPGLTLKGVRCPGARLAEANLSSSNLAGADLQNAGLQGAILEVTELAGANLSGAHLQGVNFGGSNLSGANFRNADLRSADLRDTILAGTDFTGADLSGADLRYANSERAIVTYREKSAEYNFDPSIGAWSTSQVLFDAATMTRADIRQTDLSDSTLTPEQARAACTDTTTTLPFPIRREYLCTANCPRDCLYRFRVDGSTKGDHVRYFGYTPNADGSPYVEEYRAMPEVIDITIEDTWANIP